MAPSTLARYESEWRRFREAVPPHFVLSDIVNYLASLTYSHARTARPALGFFLPHGTLDSELVSRVVAGLFRRDPLPARRVVEPSVLPRLLAHLDSWGVLESLSLERLIDRCLVLFRLSSWARSSDAARVRRHTVVFSDGFMHYVVERPKQARQSHPHHRSLVAEHPSAVRCPVRHALHLVRRTPGLEFLFGESEEQLASRVRRLLAEVGIDVTPHALRHIGASAALAWGFAVDVVCLHGGWSTERPILKHYAQAWPGRSGRSPPPHVSLAALW